MAIVRRVVQDGLQRVSGLGDNEILTRSLGNIQATDSAQVISAAAIAGGYYIRQGMTAGRTDTTDTGAALDAAMPNLAIGDSITVVVSNWVAFLLTLAGGVGVTFVAGSKTTFAASGGGTIVLTKTGVATYTMFIQ